LKNFSKKESFACAWPGDDYFLARSRLENIPDVPAPFRFRLSVFVSVFGSFAVCLFVYLVAPLPLILLSITKKSKAASISHRIENAAAETQRKRGSLFWATSEGG